MFEHHLFTVAERFIRYAQIDTQSDPQSKSHPSTEKQKDLGRLLVQELQAMGLMDAFLDEYGYVYATIPANTTKQVPVICFCAHMDTAPDCSGKGVKPLRHKGYDGGDIILPDDPSVVISPRDHPYLLEKKGEDLITASGTTLLGADDKAGVAVIMDMAQYLLQHPEFKHGKIRLLFTPDEEIGRGVDKVDLQRLGADFGYTLDAGERGTFEDETFSADGVKITFYGVSAHPGYARGKMINALKLAAHFLDSLPKDEWSPETTEGRYGFVHPVRMEGLAEKAVVEFIVRDFVTAKLGAYEEHLRGLVEDAVRAFPGARADFEIYEQYRNMKEVLDLHPQVSEYAMEAIGRAGIDARQSSARGGTDGSRLSFMGLPCPNIFTGEMAFHGKQEYVSVQDMEKAVQAIVHLAGIWEERS
ncbi:peptidase T [Flavitalea sp. BT771]|uniref:peptidase T n=1 Tax=Flavitalea sp. BT771 TaxID=3063329 RepID=UPI0026E357F1|nr:peptidase T [Flavitalea sp. BT771]MDO6429857.1 peptidase T [Flavitalea sp. BT771]MDV6218015.1 peptidase T [Flavitalea sp. BT771]